MSHCAFAPVALFALLAAAPAFAQSTPSPTPVASEAPSPTPVVVSPSGKSGCPYGTKGTS